MNLSDRQLQAAGLLARGLSVRKVAEAVEVNKSTISNWKKLDAFQGAIEDCRKSVRDGAVKAVEAEVRQLRECVFALQRLALRQEDFAACLRSEFVLGSVLEIGHASHHRSLAVPDAAEVERDESRDARSLEGPDADGIGSQSFQGTWNQSSEVS